LLAGSLLVKSILISCETNYKRWRVWRPRIAL